MSSESDNQDAAAKAAADAQAKTDADAKAKADADKEKTVPLQALHEERAKRKEADEKLAKLLEEKKLAGEEEAKKKGEFEKLFNDEKQKSTDLQKQIEGLNGKVKVYETNAQKKIDESLSSIKDDAERETVKSLLQGKTLTEQETFLPTLLKKFGTPANINQNGQGGGADSKADAEAKMKENKAKGNILGMIANAPVIAKK